MAAKKSSPLIEGGLLGRAAPMQMATAPAVQAPVVAAPPPAAVVPAAATAPAGPPGDALMQELIKLGYNPDQATPYYAGLGDQQQTEGGDGLTYWPMTNQFSRTQDIYGALKAGGVNSLSDLQAVTTRDGGYGLPRTTYVNRLTGQPVDIQNGMVLNVSGDGRAQRGNVQTILSLQPNQDGTVGTSTLQSTFDGGGFRSFINPVLQLASIIPSPIQPIAQVANAALAIKDGKPLNAALSLYGAANSAGLLGSVGDAGSAASGVGTLPTDLGLQPLTPINPVEITLQDLPMPGISAPSIPSPIDLGSGLLSPTLPGYDLSSANFPPTPAPGYSLGNPSLELPGGSLNLPPSNPLMDSLLPSVGVNQPPPVVPATPTPTRALDSQLANEQLGIKPGENSVAPSTPAVEADPSLIERGVATGRQLLAAGKDTEFYKWVTDPANSLYVKAMMAGGGALLNTVGGESKSGGPSYKDDGYRPTISRGGFQASIPAPGMASGGPGTAPGGVFSGVTLPTTGQANDGLWRYAGNRQGGLMPSLSAAMPRSLISPPPMAPQTGLINPPAVASYNPNPTGPLPTNLPPMQYGYDDPVPPNQASLTPEQQRLMSPLLGLLNTNPAPRGWM